MTWAPGDVVALQEVWQGRVWAARPLVVADDAPDRVLLWMPRGTRRQVPVPPPSRPAEPTRTERIVELLARADWVHAEHEWEVDTLWIMRPGDWFAIWVSWLPDGRQWGWYVNFQEPFRRTPLGFEAMDLMLDVVVEPDGTTWRWKDADEVDELARRGVFDDQVLAALDRAGAEVVRRIEHGAAPFSEPWPSWRADPRWPTPALPPGWDEVQPPDPPS